MPKRKATVDHHATTFGAFMQEFVMESDRAAVVLGASKIESLLGEILDKFLIPMPGSVDDLLEGDSPLATFSAKIKICHRLGLIDDQFAKLLNTFRRLRNGFAHEVTSSSLSIGAARDRVAALAEPFVSHSYFKYLRAMTASQISREESDSGVIFRATLAMFYMHLGYIRVRLVPISRQAIPTLIELSVSRKPGRRVRAKKPPTAKDG